MSIAVAVASAALPNAASARTWPEIKCDRYKASWSEALVRFGRRGLSRAFLDSHDAFLASGCTTQGGVCPRSPEEIALANVMTVAAFNAGTTDTFLPFACPK